MFKPLVKVLGIIILIAGLAYFALCGIATYKNSQGEPDTPETKYSIQIQYTKLTVLTDKYDVAGTGDLEIYTLYGYWESVKGNWVYKDITLTLNERDFGPVIVKRR